MSFCVRRQDLSAFFWWKIQTSTSFIRCREASGTKFRELGFACFACRSSLFSWSVKWLSMKQKAPGFLSLSYSKWPYVPAQLLFRWICFFGGGGGVRMAQAWGWPFVVVLRVHDNFCSHPDCIFHHDTF
jgi:hypothetical protein